MITYPFGSVPEIIEDGLTGCLVRDVASAVQAVKNISGIDRRQCRLQFEERFTATRMAKDYLDLYEELTRADPDMFPLADGVPVG